MNSNNQKYTGKKRSFPDDQSEEDFKKSEDRKRFNENFERRIYQNQSQAISYNQTSKRYDNKEQKLVQNNNFYKQSYQNASNTRNDDNYSVSPSRSPSLKEGVLNHPSTGYSDDNNENFREKKYSKNDTLRIQHPNNHNHGSQNVSSKQYRNDNPMKDSREFRDKDYSKNKKEPINQQRIRLQSNQDYDNMIRNNYGLNTSFEKSNKYQGKSSTRFDLNYNHTTDNDHFQGRNQASNSDRKYYKDEKNGNYYKKSGQYGIKSHDERERKDIYKSNMQNTYNRNKNYSDSDSFSNIQNNRFKQNERSFDKNILKASQRTNNNSSSLSRSISRSKNRNNSLSKSRYESGSKEKQKERSSSCSRKNIKKNERSKSFDEKINNENIKEENNKNVNVNIKNSIGDVKMKRFNFLMCLPKHYYRFIEKDYSNLYRDIKKKVREMRYLQYTYLVKGFADNVLRIDANKVSSNAEVLRMVCDFIFKEMKQTYQNMTYLKISILVPSHVVGFIIGIEGKNINKIRDSSGAKIDVFHENINKRYRQIELAGSVASLASAAEQIYRYVNKYYYYNPNINEHGRKLSKEYVSRNTNDDRSKSHNEEEYNHYQKNRKDRIILGGDRKRLRIRKQTSGKNKDRSSEKRDRIYLENRQRKDYKNDRKKKDNYKSSHYYNSNSPSILRSKSPKVFSRELDLNEDLTGTININNNLNENLNQKNFSIYQTEDVSNLNISNLHIPESNSTLNIKKQINTYSSNHNDNLFNQQLINDNSQNFNNISDYQHIKPSQFNTESLKNYNNIGENINKLSYDKPDNIEVKINHNKTETDNQEDYNNLQENTKKIVNNSEYVNKNESNGKISIDMIVPIQTLNLLKNFQNNIYIEMENKYGCQITKRVEKMANNEELNILTFYGEPEQNSYALFYLMRHISDIENK